MNAPLPVEVCPPTRCYHCAAPIPTGRTWHASVAGAQRQMCCPGCAAIATAIEASGMSAYYLARSAPAQVPVGLTVAWPTADRPATASDGTSPDPSSSAAPRLPAALFDDAHFQASFVVAVAATAAAPANADLREAHLLLQGLHCGACTWLIEGHLARLPGVVSVRVNPGAARLVLRWQADRLALSQVLIALRRIGYDASPWDLQRMAAAGETRSRGDLAELVVAGLGMMQVMMYSVPVYLAAPGDITVAQLRLMQWAGLALTLPVLLFSARSFFRAAWQAARQRQLTMDQPIALGLLAAFAGSLHSMLNGSGPVWFDSIAMLVFLLLAARWLERRVRRQALVVTAQHTRPMPLQALRIDPASGLAAPCSLQALQPGDRIRVAPGAALPVDGRVVQGSGPVEEALLTGESAPVWRQVGDRVLAASTNLSAVLEVTVEAVGPATVLARMMRQMDQALASRAPLATLADRAARQFVAGLLLLCALVAAFWGWRDPARVLPVLVAMLVVSCPCALALAVPATLAASTARLGRHGMLVLQGHVLETLARARTVVFDKTGTLTVGRPSVQVDWCGAAGPHQRTLAGHVLALESGQVHPLALALRACLTHADVAAHPSPLQVTASVLGQGVEGVCAGERWRIGAPAFVAALRGDSAPHSDVDADIDRGVDPGDGSVAWLGTAAGVQARFVFRDVLRPEAAAVIAQLRQQGLQVCLFSGDQPTAVAAVAAALGITDARGAMTPQDKHDAVANLQVHQGPVVMVGDGLNDGPGFAAASLSIGLGHLSEALAHGADAVIPGASLQVLARAVREARGAAVRMRQNLVWATAYNLISIPLAASGCLTPWQAGLGMSVSSLVVVLNATRRGAH